MINLQCFYNYYTLIIVKGTNCKIQTRICIRIQYCHSIEPKHNVHFQR